jgi:hypothetical protein
LTSRHLLEDPRLSSGVFHHRIIAWLCDGTVFTWVIRTQGCIFCVGRHGHRDLPRPAQKGRTRVGRCEVDDENNLGSVNQ